MDDTDDNALGTYLKDRRARLDPAALGLASKRRRTPGLRREEVAQRANVSVTWYTWLEQGRGGAPSADALDCIAEALTLSEIEREHLHLLAFGHPPKVRPADAGLGTSAVTPQLQHVLDAITAHPAMIATSSWDIVAWNASATLVFTDYAAILPEQRNTLRLMFAPGARERVADWEHHARALVASFRAETARIGPTERASVLIEELSRESPDFAAMWGERDVAALGPGTKRIARGDDPLTFDYTTFAVHGHADLHMIVYTPSTPGDAARLRELLAHARVAPTS